LQFYVISEGVEQLSSIFQRGEDILDIQALFARRRQRPTQHLRSAVISGLKLGIALRDQVKESERGCLVKGYGGARSGQENQRRLDPVRYELHGVPFATAEPSALHATQG
jgi:hypothetical protein